MSKSLFNEFPEATSKQWKQKIQVDLKGADYNDTLIWNTNEGIDVKPFYHPDEFNQPFPVSNTHASRWEICQTIYVANPKTANLKALEALSKGADTLKFIIPKASVKLSELLQNINLKATRLFFELQFLDSAFVTALTKATQSKTTYILTDIIGHLAGTGNWYQALKNDHEQLEHIVTNTACLSINGALYQNAGATITQQLAYSLAHANEYLNHLTKKELKLKKLVFNMAIGSHYFFEIAKLKALRWLVETLADAYNTTIQCHIVATPSSRNKTIYDYNTNMLRSTTECMSAILGGANTICNKPYDAVFHKNNDFSDRISRNQLLILKHESYFNSVNNPADGAYYIETLTKTLAENALALFKDIETQGGFLKQLKEGTIQRKIKEKAALEQEQFNEGAIVLLGTNKHPNKNDRMKHELELYPFLKKNPVKTLIAPILEKRLAEEFEQERLKNESDS